MAFAGLIVGTLQMALGTAADPVEPPFGDLREDIKNAWATLDSQVSHQSCPNIIRLW